MLKKCGLGFCFCWFILAEIYGQSIIYSKPLKEDKVTSWFELVGMYNEKIFILKKIKSKFVLSVYNEQMQWLENVVLTNIPEDAVGLQTFAFKNYLGIFFREVVKGKTLNYLMQNIGFDGKPMGLPKKLASKESNLNENKPSSFITLSENKQHLALILRQEKDKTITFSKYLFNDILDSVFAGTFQIDSVQSEDYCGDPMVDNNGTILFIRGKRENSYYKFKRIDLIMIPALEQKYSISPLQFDNHFLDVGKIKIDNDNGKYLFTSFYYKTQIESNIDGIVNASFFVNNRTWETKNTIPLSREIRSEVASSNNEKHSLNDYYLRNILLKKEGGFIVLSEAVFTFWEYYSFTRWDKFGKPLEEVDKAGQETFSPGYGAWQSSSFLEQTKSEVENHFTGNILVLDFDKEGALASHNIVYKNQASGRFDKTVLGFQTLNTPEAIHFFYTNYERKDLILNHQILDNSGNITRLPPVIVTNGKNTVPGLFASKQIGSRSLLVPCINGTNILFAKIDL